MTAAAPTLQVVEIEEPRRDPFDWTDEQLRLIRTQIAKDTTDDEFRLFLEVSRLRRLNPFARQIYAIVRNERLPSGQYERRMTIQTAIDGFRLVAARAGLDGIERPTFETDDQLRDKDNPLGIVCATCRVWRKGSARAFEASAYWDEYAPIYKGQLATMWAKMPRGQIGKCAEALALRRGFPEDLSGLYVEEELEQADADPTPTGAGSGTATIATKTKPDTVVTPTSDLRRLVDGAVAELTQVTDPKAVDMLWRRKGQGLFRELGGLGATAATEFREKFRARSAALGGDR